MREGKKLRREVSYLCIVFLQERDTSRILLTPWGEYKLADNAYDELLEELQEQQYKNVTHNLKKHP
ncbi:hypothetical protein ACVW0P_002305 [Mucilaginibacter sp. UYNi724]